MATPQQAKTYLIAGLTGAIAALTALVVYLQSQNWDVIPGPAKAIYVSVTGSDQYGNGTEAQPYRTISIGYSKLGSGTDTLIVQAGDYYESPEFNRMQTTVIGNDAVIAGDQLDKTCRTIYVTASSVTLEGLTIDPPDAGIWVERGHIVEVPANNFTMKRCRIVDRRYMETMHTAECQNKFTRCLTLSGDGFRIEDSHIRGGGLGVFIVVDDSPSRGILLRDTMKAQLCSNLDFGAGALTKEHVLQGILVKHCVLDSSLTEDNIQLENMYGPPYAHHGGYVIDSCVLSNAAENAFDPKGGRHVLIDNSIVYGSQGDDNGPYGDVDAWCGPKEHGMISGKAITFGDMNAPAVKNYHTIVRRSIIYDNMGFFDSAPEDLAGTKPGECRWMVHYQLSESDPSPHLCE
jgi:hypothetical protein